MRLPRPYVPKAVRVKVAERQFFESFGEHPKRGSSYFMDGDVKGSEIDGVWLRALLLRLFGDQKVHLHHDPALINREIVPVKATEKRKRLDGWFMKDGVLCHYEPEANDPNFLVYMPIDDHDVRTRVRGAHGQHSDLALARKRKRAERKAKRFSLPYKQRRRWPRPRRRRNDLRRKKRD